MFEVRNAIIEGARITSEDPGCLSAWLMLNYGNAGQGFGGYALYLPKSWKHHDPLSVAGLFIFRCMEVAEVTSWDKLVGKTVRVKLNPREYGGSIVAIGHIVKDDWFCPGDEFPKARAA